MQLVDQENGWTLFEDDKTFPDGVVVIARYVVYGDLKVDVVNPKPKQLAEQSNRCRWFNGHFWTGKIKVAGAVLYFCFAW